MKHRDALLLAASFANALRGVCERIAIVGSLRRGKPMVKDFELLIIPTSRTHALIDEWCDKRFIQPRKNVKGHPIAWGEKMRCIEVWDVRRKRWFAGDLFFTDPYRWGLTELIRTGDADFSRLIVTQRNRGGALPAHLEYKDWLLWGKDGQLVSTPTEADVFRQYGLPYLHPPVRTSQTLRYWANWSVRGKANAYRLVDLLDAETPVGVTVSKYGSEYHWSRYGDEIPAPSGVVEIGGVWYGDGRPLRLPAEVQGLLEMWRNRHVTGQSHLWVGQSSAASSVHLPAGKDGYAPPMPQRVIFDWAKRGGITQL